MSVDVAIVGAGLAGLAAARTLHQAGLVVQVLEAQSSVGGRVRTDRVDGLQLDHGFQLLNPAYPEAARVLDLEALDLRPLTAGVIVALDNGYTRLGDPRRRPTWALSSMSTSVGSPLEKARFARYALRCALASPQRLRRSPDVTAAEALRSAGIDGDLYRRVLHPFLSGVLLEDRLVTSRRFVDLVLRSFVRGTPALPARGMQAIPEQLAAGLPEGTVTLDCPVHTVTGTEVRHAGGTTRARAVIVATEASVACELVPGVPQRFCHDVTTWYHLARVDPHRLVNGEPALLVDGNGGGPLVNTTVLTHAAPEYASEGRVLVASSALGLRNEAADERRAREHAARLYGIAPLDLEHVRTDAIRDALPSMPVPYRDRRPVHHGPGLYVAGDHQDTPSIQGALVSGRRAATALLRNEGITR